MKRYALADWLTADEIGRILAVPFDRWDAFGSPTDALGRCPIAVAIGCLGTPTNSALEGHFRSTGRVVPRPVLAEFTHAWDTRRIAGDQLPAALGVEP
jgi:hypothetical protein